MVFRNFGEFGKTKGTCLLAWKAWGIFYFWPRLWNVWEFNDNDPQTICRKGIKNKIKKKGWGGGEVGRPNSDGQKRKRKKIAYFETLLFKLWKECLKNGI